MRISDRAKRPIRLRYIIALMIVIAAGFLLFGYEGLSSVVVELAVSEAYENITYTVNEVIAEKVMEDEIDYKDMVSLEKDDRGNITALVTNMANVNFLQAEVTNAVVKRFAESDVTTVTVPVGSLFGNAFLSGKGPKVTVDILSVTNVKTAFRNEFSSAGINQTRHRIVMDVEVTLGILLAGYESNWKAVTTEITVAETVIVGSVPNTYASIGE